MLLLDYTQRSETRIRPFYKKIDWDDPLISKYYEERSGNCAYCNSALDTVFSCIHPFSGDFRHSDILSCQNCGWWNVLGFDEDSMELSYIIPSLRTFEIESQELPLTALTIELKKHPDVVTKIHSKKYEQLVQDILKDFYATEVSYVGRRGDGGIDLIFCDGDIPIAVQVKRRKDTGHVEGVALVREFLGAMLLKGFKAGILVTTAQRFTSGSRETAQNAISMGLVTHYELLNRSRFIEMFRLKSKRANYPWEEAFGGGP
jgi:restriction system protein